MDPNPTPRARRSKAAAAVALAVLALVTRLALTAAPAGAAVTYTVTSTGDDGSSSAQTSCNNGGPSCTFRAALLRANADGQPTTINFNIPGDGPHTIASQTGAGALPGLTSGGTTINGYSQPGAQPNTDAFASNAVIKIQLQGVNGQFLALSITSSNNVIRGLAIYGANRDIRIGTTFTQANGNTVVQSGHDNVIAGNFLGTNAAGTFGYTTRDNGNDFGVTVRSASKRNIIGGPAPADRNVISGHQGRAILIGVPGTGTVDTGVQDNVVQNNIMGLTPDGTAARPNYGHAVDINNGASRNRVEGNVISGQAGEAEGIEVSHAVTTFANEVLNNKIGTNPAGTAAPAYARNDLGIRVEDGADETVVRGNIVGNNAEGGIYLGSLTHTATQSLVEDNFVGVTPDGTPIPNGGPGIVITPGEGNPSPAAATDSVITGNTIAHNPVGISVLGSGSVRNRISENSIHDNDGLGIDLPPLGQVNQNDAGDGDTGANTLLNWPVLTGATPLTVSGTACGGCTVEVYEADSTATLPGSEQTSYGEGQTLLASTTAGPGGSFLATLPPDPSSRIVTATATDSAGNTSEFSKNLAIPGQTEPNDPPQPAFTATCPDLGCSFDASATSDPDGDDITSYDWDFGDGGAGSGATTTPTYATEGTYHVTLTVHDERGATGSTTATVFVSPGTRLGRDGFTRTVASGWGSAETGGAWTGSGGNDGLSVDGGAGVADVPAGGSRDIDLDGVSADQTDASVTVTTDRAPFAGDHVIGIVARRQDATLAYVGRLRIEPDGTVHAGAEAGTTLLGEQPVAGLTASPGTALRLRVRVTGTDPSTIEVKVWRAEDAEPAAWSFTTTDSTTGLQQAGVVGLRASSSEALIDNVEVRFDDVDVVAPPTSTK